VGEAGDGREVLRKTRELLPDIVVMDAELPVTSGLAAAEALRTEFPQIKVLILSEGSSPELFLRVIQTGAAGYMLKEASLKELVKALEALAAGEEFFCLDNTAPARKRDPRDNEDPTAAATKGKSALEAGDE
jgi:two-component system nitrate/nitrite response regulator NarL